MLDNELMEQFCQFLSGKIGIYYPRKRWSDLEKKLDLIKKSFGFEDIEDCLRWIMKNPIDKKTMDVLIINLTVGETYFFRDPKVFTALEHQIIPNIIERCKKQRSIKIWSAACCTGEEPYSIAILLNRLIPNLDEWKVSILGTDVNAEFLQKAKKANYKKWSFRTTPLEIIERYFQKEREVFTLVPEVRKMVQFQYLNLVEDSYPDPRKEICNFDLILCHNVLIYFSNEQVKKTIHQLTESLSDNGWLSLSAIEAPFITEADLVAKCCYGSYFFQKKYTGKESPLSEHLDIPSAYSLPQTPENFAAEANPAAEKPTDFFADCYQLYQEKAYQEVIARLHSFLSQYVNDSEAIRKYSNEIILLMRTYANQGSLRLALEWSDIALHADKLNPMHHYFRAILLQDQGNIPEAIRFLKNALFIDSHYVMAYVILGILEEQQGSKEAASRNLKAALELMKHHLPSDILQNSEEYTVEYLRELISNHLKNLQESEA